MGVFVNVDELQSFECAKDWDGARRLLYQLWCGNRKDIGILCRLISESWYVLVERDCCGQNEDNLVLTCKSNLIEATQYGLAYFDSNATFLWTTGYMISLFPDLFYEDNSDELYIEWERRGNNMLLLATQLEPDNPISKILYLGTKSMSTEYQALKKSLKPILDKSFPGKTAIEEYFRSVLSI